MRLAEVLPGALSGAVQAPPSRCSVTRLLGVVALGAAANFGICAVEVDADVVGLDDAAVGLRTFVAPAACVFAAGDDHGVTLMEGDGGVLAQLELCFHKMGSGVAVRYPLALADLPRVPSTRNLMMLIRPASTTSESAHAGKEGTTVISQNGSKT